MTTRYIFNFVLLLAFAGTLSAADYWEKIPEELKSSVSAYFPFDGSYADVNGKVDAQYFNAKEQKSYSVAEAASSGVTFVPGRDGKQAIQFGDGKAEVQNSSSNVNLGQVDYSNDFTISFWANNMFKTPYGSYPVFFGNSDWKNCEGEPGQGFLVSTLTDTKVIMNVQGQGLKRTSPRPQSNADADWHYITMTGNRKDGKFSLYIDGKLLIDGESDGDYAGSVGKSLQNTAPTRIGSDGYGSYGFYGAISDFIIFDKALSINEVRLLVSAYTGKEFIIPLTKTYDTVKNEDGSVTVTAKFKNEGKSAQTVRVAIEMMGDGVLLAKQDGVLVPRLMLGVPAQSEQSMDWTVKAMSGSVKLFLVTEENEGKEILRMGSVTSGKAGWVSGDSHDHSLYSDGSGTIAQNFVSAQKQGIDFVTITDHSNSRGWDDALIAGTQYGIIPIRGNEYSHRTYSHALFINVNQEKNYSSLDPPVAVQALKDDTNGKGLAFVAHPFDDGKDHWQETNGWEAPIDGIEVWNSWYAGRYVVNAKAFAKWDELNTQGRRLYGITTTDTHSARYIGEAYTTVFTEEYTAEGILDGHRAGRMYGSNGPVIDFKLGNAMMGDTVGVAKEGKEVTFAISGEYFLPLSKVLLVMNGTVVYTKEINANEFAESVQIFVKPGDFVRMEVEGTETDTRKLDGATFDTSAPFAFTNPIFFVEE
jgi:predicted metal-dependent phosphoesterase TrpH